MECCGYTKISGNRLMNTGGKRLYRKKVNLIIGVTICMMLIVDIDISATNNNIENEINSNNQIIDDLQKEKDEINDVITNEEVLLKDIEAQIDRKREEVVSARDEVEAFEEDINRLQQEINNKEQEIITSKAEVEKADENIKKLIDEKANCEDLLDNRIRNYYKYDIGNQYIYAILNSENIFDLIAQVININKLMTIDRELIQGKKELELELNSQKKIIEENLIKQEADKIVVLEKQEEIIEKQKSYIVIKEKEERELSELQALEDEKGNLIASLEGERADIDNQIGDLLSYNKELQNQLDSIFEDLEDNSDDQIEYPEENANSGFIRPVPGVITCEYGPRINPVTFEPGFHNGIDYAGNTGEPIVATKSGVVEYSGWIEGYGNTIILNHGNGEKSLYAHASSLTVAVGESVMQGSTVALIGTTGMSTGPHLHFEIRINEQAVDPFSYIPY